MHIHVFTRMMRLQYIEPKSSDFLNKIQTESKYSVCTYEHATQRRTSKVQRMHVKCDAENTAEENTGCRNERTL